jgi:hypothetical protein
MAFEISFLLDPFFPYLETQYPFVISKIKDTSIYRFCCTSLSVPLLIILLIHIRNIKQGNIRKVQSRPVLKYKPTVCKDDWGMTVESTVMTLATQGIRHHQLPHMQNRNVKHSLIMSVYAIHTYVSTVKPNVMHFLFNLLRTKGLYMFQASLAHPLEALHKRHLVYCLHIMSVGCRGTANWHTHAIYQVPFVQHLPRISK